MVRSQIIIDPTLRSNQERPPWDRIEGSFAIFNHPMAIVHWKKYLGNEELWAAPDPTLEAFSLALSASDGRYRTFVSLGAGDGNLDRALLQRLSYRAEYYVAVDLNIDLCRTALHNVSPLVKSAAGVICDLERNGFAFLESVLAESKTKPPRIIVCTGNMIGNLDLGEAIFFRRAIDLLDVGDIFICSVSVGAFPRPLSRFVFDTRVGWDDLRDLFAAGLSSVTGEPFNLVSRTLEQRMQLRRGWSDVPNTDSIALLDGLSGRQIIHMRRYRFNSLVEWLNSAWGLRIRYHSEIPQQLEGLSLGIVSASK